MRKSAIGLVAILALALAIVPVAAPATIHSIPVNPPNCTNCSPAGGYQITVPKGTQTVPINFTINVVKSFNATNIQAYFIANDTNSFNCLSSVTMTQTGMGSPVTGTNGNALTQHGPYTGTPWTYPPAGPVFPGSTWYNFSYVWTFLQGPSKGFNDWIVINVTFTTTCVSSFYILAAGNSNSATNFDNPYRTPYSETTNVVVIPEFFLGTLAAIIMPLLALAGYMHFKRNESVSPAVSLNT